MRKRTSKIWLLDKNRLQELLDSSHSIVDILKKLEYDGYNGNHRTINQRVKQEGLSLDKFNENKKEYHKIHIRKLNKDKKIPCEKIFIQNSTYLCGNNLKQRMVDELGFEYKCSVCNISEWNGKKLSLQIDHINGVHNDNRIENIRLLCPNCHSQTRTYGGRKTKKANHCKLCGKGIYKTSKVCFDCHAKHQRRKVKNRPSLEQLEKEVEEMGYCAVGRKYGVSDNAIRKWIKQYYKTKEEI